MDKERQIEDERRERELAALEKKLADMARERILARQKDIRMGTLRRAEPVRERENPLDEPARHKAAQQRSREQRLQAIKSAARQQAVRESVEKYYESWTNALKKAYALRYDLSQRLYERHIHEKRIDERLIPDTEKQSIRQQAIREAVFNSQSRMEEINRELPKMIDRAIDMAASFEKTRSPFMDRGGREKGDFER